MEQNSKKHIQQLEAVLDSVNDGKVCYKLATEKIHTESIKELLIKYAEERNQISREIRERITKMGGTATANEDEDNASILSRAMLNLKAAFSNDVADEQAALELCRSSDQTSLETFDGTLQGELLETDLKPFLMTQRYKISKAFYEIDKVYFQLFKTNPEL